MPHQYSHLAIGGGVSPAYAQASPGNPMSDEELMSYIESELADARSYTDDFAGEERVTNINRYFRRPFGNEQEGRSQVMTSDVSDTVDSLVPAMLKIFASTDKVVEFAGRSAEDVNGAEQATIACNYVFYTQNEGFLRLYEAIQDGFLVKTGYLKYWWDKSYVITEEFYEDLGEEDIQWLQRDEDVEILEIQPTDSGISDQPDMGGMQQQIPQARYACKIKRKKEKGKICIECVPPEEIKVSPRTRSANIQEAPFVCHETEKTRSQLIADGYDYDTVMALPAGTDTNLDEETRLARRDDSYNVDNNPANAIVHVQECYFRADVDGDGIEELRKVCRVGGVMLSNHIIDDMGIVSWCPKIIAHEFIGQCPADDVIDIMEQKSSILRQSFDSLYQANVPRWQVSRGNVDLDDLLTAKPGGVVRMRNIGDAVPLTLPFVGQQTFPMIEYLDSIRENRTGVTRYNQGLDANSLNKTATGINIITNMSQQKIELYARIFAELLLKPLFRGVLGLLAKHQLEPLSFRLNNNYVSVDPSAWKNEYDMTINVGLGTGNKDQQLMHLSQISAAQAGIAMSPFGQMLISPKEVYNTQAKIAENAGFKDPSMFWKDPGNAMPPPPPPHPQMMKDQAEHQLAQQKEMHRHSERMIELRLEMAKLGMPMQVMQELGMPDPIGLGLPQAMPPMNGNGQMPPPGAVPPIPIQ